eukprot:CAMPEP_0184358312 /NCGR_PEP_ID=MMETSP1089-20130417/113977_1 /TAXON_ID=38269 ORGANISM="Gloeochaete wittrockiana, Strain SAG46.84" /NCGR_SAMPLE_ID=MMETSP1089 /ASSEMBLY_ACC=CAM_ASM_000445 /LENGTH=151 /DNA_ID=CAMNT_0026696577 /DNA_START=37 /DNA_END=488 /DNA_ORIENTATION=+
MDGSVSETVISVFRSMPESPQQSHNTKRKDTEEIGSRKLPDASFSCQDVDFNEKMINLNWILLRSIECKLYDVYEYLVDSSVTCFEPESNGALVQGMEFHKFYFDLPSYGKPGHTTIASPVVRILGDSVAVVAFERLTQRMTSSGPVTTKA